MKNFNLSVIMPFYKRLETFRLIFAKNAPYFQRNGIEVIIVMDEPTEQAGMLGLMNEYPLINWVLLVNEIDHEWRNPGKAINVGIRHATKQYVLVTDPELEFATDIIYELRNHLDYYPNHYCVGRVIFGSFDDHIHAGNFDQLNLLKLYYGSIMAPRACFENISGYSEQYEVWGGEDDNIRTRFDLAGYQRLECPRAMLVHREDFSQRETTRDQQRTQLHPQLLSDMLIPVKCRQVPNSEWGYDFNNLVYHWDRPSSKKKELLLAYLSQRTDIKQFSIQNNASFSSRYRLIVLLPAYNESHRIAACIKSIEPFCSGIIILDDGSSDHTYELIHSELLFIKVSKERKGFNDLDNRNILLDIASFYCSDWFMFIDADERISAPFCDLHSIMQRPGIDIIGVWLINLWDNNDTYRADQMDPVYHLSNGLWFRWRLFRSKGRLQIHNDQSLHCLPVPYFENCYISSTLLHHTGYLHGHWRADKFKFYHEIDSQSTDDYYGQILCADADIRDILTVTKDVIEAAKCELHDQFHHYR